MAEMQPNAEGTHVPNRSASDCDSLLEGLARSRAPLPVREGLPATYRMRADAHYVEQLDAWASSTPIRYVTAQEIDVPGGLGASPSAAFVDSVERYGILQPLLVQKQDDRYRLLAGRKRLAAALASGLRQVPCLICRGEGEQAEAIAAATNLPSTDQPAGAQRQAGSGQIEVLERELVRTLESIGTAVPLAAGGTPLAQAVGVSLVRLHAMHAADVLLAHRLIRNERPMTSVPVEVSAVLEGVAARAALERRLRQMNIEVRVCPERITLEGDEEMLRLAVRALLHAALTLIEDAATGSISVSARLERASVTFSVTSQGVSVPASWLASAFDVPWPTRGGGPALALLQAARKVAQLHGGSVAAAFDERGTTLMLTVAVASHAVGRQGS